MLKAAYHRSSLILGAVLGVAVGAPAVGADLGSGQIQTKLSTSVDYDSNIYLNNNDVSDTTGTATASVNYTRDVAIVADQVSIGAVATAFADHSSQNSIDPFANGSVSYTPSDKTVMSGSLGYTRSTLANEELNTRTKSDEYSADGSFQNLFSEKLGLRLTGDYHDSVYLTTGYADVLSYSLGLSGVYVYSPKLTMTTGFTERESWTENRPTNAGRNPASKDNRYDVGFEGELAPKISGTLHVGWTQRSFDASVFNNESTLFLSTGLKWVPRQKTTVTIDASRDFGTTAASQSTRETDLSVSVNQVLTDRWSAIGSVSFGNADYQGSIVAIDRRDNTYRLKAQASYEVVTNVQIDFSIGYANVDSTNIFSTYDRVNAGVGVTATF